MAQATRHRTVLINRIHRFAEIVNAGGLSAPARTPRGRDVLAVCGQFRSASLRSRREKVPADTRF